MIRTNLATKPFYNERAVHLALLGAAALVVAATAFNVTSVLRLSRRDTLLVTQASRDEAQAVDVRERAARLRATVDPRDIEAAAADARQANELIDRRTFSWIELFNTFETTLPEEVRIASMRPKLEPKRGIVLTMNVLARGVEDVNLFIDRLQATGAFAQLQKLDERVNDENQLQATLESVYIPGAWRRAAEGAKQ